MTDLIERLRDAAEDAAAEEYGVSGLLAEAADAIDAMQWQPIETAPKDGRDILVSEYGDLVITFWSRGVSKWLGPYDSFGDPEVMGPTHWMPLPAPPKEASND